MAMITVNVTLTKTVAVLDGASIAAILAWVKANVNDKLPADTTAGVTLSINT
jgi:hypothetical protein